MTKLETAVAGAAAASPLVAATEPRAMPWWAAVGLSVFNVVFHWWTTQRRKRPDRVKRPGPPVKHDDCCDCDVDHNVD